ncbi:hypothetical protein SDC9_120755 [bioreactor metagenome]|uniref:Uncharacterized protein n=1 Tax=bioreactor metagenome TaxID=1076179 RepID=A0A645CA14_9ZZZZ
MRGRQLQMIPLQRVRDAAPGEKHAPQKRGPAALLLQQTEIDVQHHVLLRRKAKRVDNTVQLTAVGHLKHQLSLRIRLRLSVKPEAKGPV